MSILRNLILPKPFTVPTAALILIVPKVEPILWNKNIFQNEMEEWIAENMRQNAQE